LVDADYQHQRGKHRRHVTISVTDGDLIGPATETPQHTSDQ
jgi:hypothetical protein